MNWSFSWMAWGALAFVLAVVNLARLLTNRRKGWPALMFASLSCGALSLLAEYRMAGILIENGEFSALEDIVPYMGGILAAAVYLGLAVNFFVLILGMRRGHAEKSEQ